MIDVWRIMSRWICSIIYLYILQRLWLQQPGLGGGGGGDTLGSSDGDRMGPKMKTKKIPRASNKIQTNRYIKN